MGEVGGGVKYNVVMEQWTANEGLTPKCLRYWEI